MGAVKKDGCSSCASRRR